MMKLEKEPSQTQFQTDPPMALDLTLECAARRQRRLGERNFEDDCREPDRKLPTKT